VKRSAGAEAQGTDTFRSRTLSQQKCSVSHIGDKTEARASSQEENGRGALAELGFSKGTTAHQAHNERVLIDALC